MEENHDALRKAYISEFRNATGLKKHEALIFQFYVDAFKHGLEVNGATRLLITGDAPIVKDSLVWYKFPSEAIDYIKGLNVQPIYEAAGVPITRDYPDYTPSEEV